MAGVDHPFAIVPCLMLTEVKPTSVVVYAVLAEHANADQECWPSVGRIARRANLTPNTVRSATKELVDAGWLTVRGRATDDGRQTSNLYKIRRVRNSDVTPQILEGSHLNKPRGPRSRNDGRTRPNELNSVNQQAPNYLSADATREMLNDNQPDEPSDPSASVRRVRSALDDGVRAGRSNPTSE